MRIIAGVAKGRSLSSVAGATRPTSDRAREAISLVHCVEKDDAAAKTISTNSVLVQKAQTVGAFHLFHMAVQKFVEGKPENQYHFVYIDPPYDFADVELTNILVKLHSNNFFKDGAVIAVERASKTAQPTWPEGYEPSRTKVYGQASIYYANYAKNG